MVPTVKVVCVKQALVTMIETSTTVNALAMSTTGALLAKPTTMATLPAQPANQHSFETLEFTAWTNASLLNMC